MNPKITTLIEHARDNRARQDADETAYARLPTYPHNGCAAFLSALLTGAGIDTGVILSAGTLASTLEARGWERVALGDQQPGDVGVTDDLNHNGIPDHVYLVVERVTADLSLVADNQSHSLHERYASGRGKTPTSHYLRAAA